MCVCVEFELQFSLEFYATEKKNLIIFFADFSFRFDMLFAGFISFLFNFFDFIPIFVWKLYYVSF